MKLKKIVSVFAISVFVCSVLVAAGLRFGMTGAVKQKVKELDEKVREKKAVTTTTPLPAQTPQGLSGTAAKGAAIASKTVLVKDATGYLSATGTTGTDGKFNIDITSMTFPLLLKVTDGTSVYFSIANASGTCNIHPFTDLVVRTYFKSTKGVSDMSTAFESNFSSLGTLPATETINIIKSVVATVVSSILERNGLDPLTYDMFTTAFDANSTGFDRAIEQTQITAGTNYDYVVIKDTTTNIVISTITPTANDTTAPAAPTGVVATGTSGTTMKISWTAPAGTDIAGYAIYRNDVKIAAVPYTTYIDTGLVTATQYSYTIEAYDWAGNKSAKTTAVTGTTLTEFDIAVTTYIETGYSVGFDGTNYLVGMQAYDGGNQNKITAQLVSQSGTLVGPLIEVGRFGPPPEVAFDGKNYLLVWEDYVGPPASTGTAWTNNAILGQFVSTSGLLIGTTFQISPVAGTRDVSVKFDGQNYFVLYADDNKSNIANIYGQFISTGGALVGSEVSVSVAAGAQTHGSLEYCGGKYLAIWLDSRNNSGYIDVYGQFVSTSGALIGSNFAIDISAYPSDNGTTMVYDNVNNKFFVSFHDEISTDNWNLYGRMVDSNGNVSSRFVISDKPDSQRFAQSVFDGSKYLVLWTDGIGIDVKNQARFFDVNGNTLGNEFTVLTKKGSENFIWSAPVYAGGKYFLSILRTTISVDQNGNWLGATAGDISGMFINP
ncbi:MAG: hypothetical protein HY919_02180 [Elusimicrobia bacterium]|nr:hypothetical protein [Elusimicrobiota bacterium]